MGEIRKQVSRNHRCPYKNQNNTNFF